MGYYLHSSKLSGDCMSKGLLIRMVILAHLLGTMCVASLAQNCKFSGTSAWNASLRNIISDCAFELQSPDDLRTLVVSASGVISLRTTSGPVDYEWKGPQIEPPGMISWSPQSNAFFVNDGEGSGMSSKFRLFKVKGVDATEDASVERTAVSLYRRRIGCNATAADPSVWGVAWEGNGDNIFLLVQATVDEPCGLPGAFIGLIVRTSDGAILECLSENQVKKRFGHQLPKSFF